MITCREPSLTHGKYHLERDENGWDTMGVGTSHPSSAGIGGRVLPTRRWAVSADDSSMGQAALARARDQDRLIWSDRTSTGRHLRMRDKAVAEALAAGVSKEQLADELGVLISDIERIVADQTRHPAAHSRSGVNGR